MYIYLHQAEDNLFVSFCERVYNLNKVPLFCLQIPTHIAKLILELLFLQYFVYP